MGHPRKLMTLKKTIIWSLRRQTIFFQNCQTTSDFYSVAFLIHLTLFRRILPLSVCSFFTGFLLTKSLFCTSTSFLNSCKIRGQSFCRPLGFLGRLRALEGHYLPPQPDPCNQLIILLLSSVVINSRLCINNIN